MMLVRGMRPVAAGILIGLPGWSGTWTACAVPAAKKGW